MNRKQKICLLVGITAIVVIGLFPPWVWERKVSNSLGSGRHEWKYITESGPYSLLFNPPARAKFVDLYRLGIQYFSVAVVTAGLIIILRNKKVLDDQKQKVVKQKQKVVNLKRGLKRLTLSLAIVAAIASAALGVFIVQEDYEDFNLPSGFVLDTEEPTRPTGNLTPAEQIELAELEAEFGGQPEGGIEPSRLGAIEGMKLVGLCFLAGLGWGVAGFSAIWVGYLIVWLLCMFIRWLVLGFRDNNRLRTEKP